jgi:Phosphodiester glycosidase/SPOR domain
MIFRPTRSGFVLGSVTVASVLVMTSTACSGGPSDPAPSPDPDDPLDAPLPLGPSTLSEERTTRQLQPGVTLTTIVRGYPDPTAAWTVEIAIPSAVAGAPATALASQADAENAAAALRTAGLEPRIELVSSPQLADAGGELGYRVRVGATATKADADALRAQVQAAGLGGSSIFTGWDGEPEDLAQSTGPWHVQVLTIDPQDFRGTLAASYGPDLEQRETTSALAAAAGARAAMNAGYFVLNPNSGAPGDPAGVAVYDGRLVSEPISGRPALVIRNDALGTSMVRLTWRGEVRAGTKTLLLDGLNRVPGLIRNCGGTTDDLPTNQPVHDFTCTDADELIAFDSSYGLATPAGPGLEVAVDPLGVVLAVRTSRGGSIPVGGRTIQATGSLVSSLQELADTGHIEIEAALEDDHGSRVETSWQTSIVNGGPELVRDGRLQVTSKADGMAPDGNPSFYYGFVHKRNPRTIAGVDDRGRTVLITADGRSTESLGLGLAEAAAVAESLGLRDALNLDGGGSTTMVADGSVINKPSDAAGERPVGDALLVLPED